MRIPYLMKRGIYELHDLGFYSSVVGGGAPRDLYHKKPIKDVDFFLEDPTISGERIKWGTLPIQLQKIAMLESFPPVFLPHILGFDTENCVYDANTARGRDWLLSAVNFSDKDDYDYGQATDLTQIWDFFTERHTPLQFMFLKSNPIEFVTTKFDIGLCMCYYDGRRMRYTDEFLEDSTNQKFTVCGQISEHQLHKTVSRHIPRLQKKYPWHTVEFAPHIMEKILEIQLTV